MRYRKLDTDGDMRFGNQQSDFYRDVPQAVGQAVQTRLGLIAGEWYVDVSSGVPYQGGVLGKYTKDTADPILRDTILNTQGVSSILAYESSSNQDTRLFSVTGSIDSIYGETPITGVV